MRRRSLCWCTIFPISTASINAFRESTAASTSSEGFGPIIRERLLTVEKMLAYRSESIVHSSWIRCDWLFTRPDLLASNFLTETVGYAKVREASLQVFLSDPHLLIDTDHLERGLRSTSLEYNTCFFTWAEFDAMHIGLIRSLTTPCGL